MFNPKKKYFNAMLNDASKIIWDLEFKKFTAMNERELVRRQLDQASQFQPKDEDEKKALEKRISDIKKELDAIDGTVLGSAPTELLPNGAKGIDNSLTEWVNRREYIKSFIATI